MRAWKTGCPFLSVLGLMIISSCVRESVGPQEPQACPKLAYQREEKISTLKIGDRKRTFSQPVLFPESQLKYGLFQNYLHLWIDRPLFFDRATRYPSGTFAYTTKDSFLRDWEIAKKYEFDGLGNLDNGRLYKITDQYLREANAVIGFYEFPEIGFSEQPNTEPDIKVFVDLFQTAQCSPYTAKPNGKMLFLSYNTASVSLDKHRLIQKALREKFGDTFTIAGGLRINHQDEELYKKTGTLPAASIEAYRKQAQETLDVFGALQVDVTMRINDVDGDYTFSYTTEPFVKHLLPMLLDLMKRPENQGRLIGCSLRHCYINHFTGVNDGEYGTARLRDSMDAAMLLNPDFLLFFEWNEVNENTCFQPTLYNSMALQRILKYYARSMRGQTATPNPGDDQRVPDLILSHRETLKLGERLQFELLNVPDTDTAATYQATLTLRDSNGNSIFRFPTEKINDDKLQAITYSIPSEQLADHAVILPELETVGPDGARRTFADFQYVRIQPTMCYNYKAVRQPLRDMLKPDGATIDVSRNADGSYKAVASINAPESLASLEIVDNGSEAAALDKANEFDLGKNLMFIGTMSAKKSKSYEISIKVDNSSGWRFRPWEAPNITFGTWRREGDAVRGSAYVWIAPNRFIITVPKTEIAAGVLDITIDGEKYTVPLADLAKNHKAARVLHCCRIDLEKFNKLADVPARIKEKNGNLSAELVSDFNYPILQTRAVTESGKIFRGKPVLPVKLSGAKIPLNVLSETSGKVVSVNVATERVPLLNYRFDPARGAMLLNSYESYYDAQLGGGFIYDEAFHATPLPDGMHNPKWEKDGSDDVLAFNGVDQYINFPLEAFPRGSFTLAFEMNMSKTDKPQVLFRHFGHILGSISLYVKDGKLCAGYGDKALKTTKIQTDLAVPTNRWTKLKITYDLNELTFEVDGKRYARKFSGRPLYFKPAIFGGHTKKEFGIDEDMQFFNGKLKSISIKHCVEK